MIVLISLIINYAVIVSTNIGSRYKMFAKQTNFGIKILKAVDQSFINPFDEMSLIQFKVKGYQYHADLFYFQYDFMIF